MNMEPTAAAAPVPAAAQISPSMLQNVNPQQLMMASVMADLMNNGGRNTSSIVSGMSALQPNQTATNNRSAMQSLSGFQQLMANQGGTGGLGGIVKRLVGDIPIVGSSTGPGQFESSRQSTAATIAQATGLPINAALQYLPNFGDDEQTANSKIATLQTMLSSGYNAALNPASLNPTSQQSYGGVPTTGLSPINAGTGATSVLSNVDKALSGSGADAAADAGASTAATAGTSLADLAPEALAFL